jgi:hypothetical protein
MPSTIVANLNGLLRASERSGTHSHEESVRIVSVSHFCDFCALSSQCDFYTNSLSQGLEPLGWWFDATPGAELSGCLAPPRDLKFHQAKKAIPSPSDVLAHAEIRLGTGCLALTGRGQSPRTGKAQ